MKEDEARQKWCPYGEIQRQMACLFITAIPNATASGIGEAVDYIDKEEANKCIASDCMMWREITESETKVQNEMPDGELWRESGVGPMSGHTIWQRDIPIGGYCGLGGKP